MVLWEIATLASQPYSGLSNEDVIRYVVDHRRHMEKPVGCPQKLYDFMCLCWRYDKKDRPAFADILAMLVPDLNDRFRQVGIFAKIREAWAVSINLKAHQLAGHPGNCLIAMIFQESYYCTQRHLKDFNSRFSSNAKNRHSSVVDDQQSSSEAALITSDAEESTDDRCFATSLTECSTSSAEVSCFSHFVDY